MRRSHARCVRQAPCSWARRTCTSSRSERRATSRPSARCITPPRSSIRRADRAAAPPSPSPPACRSRRSAPTPVARSRIPAAACGLVGLKPTVGEVPTGGVIPLSRTLDHAGPLALDVADAAIVYAALVGRDAAGPGAGFGGGAPAGRARRLLHGPARASASGPRSNTRATRSIRRRPARARGPAARHGDGRDLSRHPVPGGGGLSRRHARLARGALLTRHPRAIRGRAPRARGRLRPLSGAASRFSAPRSTSRSTGVRRSCSRPFRSWCR